MGGGHRDHQRFQRSQRRVVAGAVGQQGDQGFPALYRGNPGKTHRDGVPRPGEGDAGPWHFAVDDNLAMPARNGLQRRFEPFADLATTGAATCTVTGAAIGAMTLPKVSLLWAPRAPLLKCASWRSSNDG